MPAYSCSTPVVRHTSSTQHKPKARQPPGTYATLQHALHKTAVNKSPGSDAVLQKVVQHGAF